MTHDAANAPHASVFTAAPTAAAAARYYAERLAMTTDPSDVAAELAGDAGFVVVDSRSRGAWDEGHIPGALHIPTRDIAETAPSLIPAGTPVVVYCWSPGCNGGTRAALEFALAGYPVKELLGGFEYWVREGYEFETGDGSRHRHPVDARTGIAPGVLAAGGVAADGAPVACAC